MLVIFDCDGVLIDSEAIFCTVDAEALTKLGFPTQASEISERFVGVPHRVAWERLSAELNIQLPEDWVDNILLECARRFEVELKPLPGAKEAIRALQAAGHSICVASSTELTSLKKNLSLAGIYNEVEPWIFSASQVKRSKPAPDVFLYAASQMGFDPSETIVIEDSIPGVSAAKRAGMRVIGFAGGGHAYDSLHSRLAEAGAEYTARALADVVDLILRKDQRKR